MLREIQVGPGNLDEVGAALQSLRACEDVLILRRGALEYRKDQWFSMLEHRFGLMVDRRHFTPGARIGEPTTDPGAEPEMVLSDWWEIAYQPDLAHAYTYSKTRQPLHTDNGWFADPAEINFFIMEKQAAHGGEQTIYPLSRLIDDLSAEEPALFADLTNVRVTIKKGEHDYFNNTRIIELSKGPSIYWNFYRTEKPTAEISRMCDSFFAYLERKESTRSVERIRCDSGDCLSFNDLRMLHGRTAFEASKPRDRVFLHSMWKIPRRLPEQGREARRSAAPGA